MDIDDRRIRINSGSRGEAKKKAISAQIGPTLKVRHYLFDPYCQVIRDSTPFFSSSSVPESLVNLKGMGTSTMRSCRLNLRLIPPKDRFWKRDTARKRDGLLSSGPPRILYLL